MAEIKAYRKICGVCPEGQKITGVSVAFDTMIDAASLSADTFAVENRRILDVYTSEQMDGSVRTSAGTYVILQLDPGDEESVLADFDGEGPGAVWVRRSRTLTLLWKKEVKLANGIMLAPTMAEYEVCDEIEPIADKFTQHVYHSERYNKDLPYNLFLPAEYDSEKRYPLVMFIHDRGPLSKDVKTTLRQGIGALVFADPKMQQKHPAIIVAPQFSVVPNEEADPGMREVIFELLEMLMSVYAVDKNRIYTTGQSMGGMTSISLGILRPDFFTAMLLVACQWDAEAMSVLHDNKLMIIISRGDPRAYPEMQKDLAALEEKGAVVVRGEWDQEGGVPEEQVKQLLAEEGNVHFAVLKTEERGFPCHMKTWQVAYQVQGAIDWLFAQSK